MNSNSIEFEKMMTKSAARLLQTGNARELRADRPARTVAQRRPRARLADIGLFLGISLFASVVFVAAFTPVSVEVSRLRTDALIVLILAQCAIAAGASLKAVSPAHTAHNTKAKPGRMRARSTIERRSNNSAGAVGKLPRLPTIALSSGLLRGKVYVAFSDGSVEIDTMLGRRRFVDLESARDFVGE